MHKTTSYNTSSPCMFTRLITSNHFFHAKLVLPNSRSKLPYDQALCQNQSFHAEDPDWIFHELWPVVFSVIIILTRMSLKTMSSPRQAVSPTLDHCVSEKLQLLQILHLEPKDSALHLLYSYPWQM